MNIETTLPLIETILGEWEPTLGRDYPAYKNHVYRVVHFCRALQDDLGEEAREKIILAGCFHDLGIWTEDTFDYLSPSVELARSYLQKKNQEQFFPEIKIMIEQHHKITRYDDPRYPLAELFRQADWVDVSLGIRSFGVSKSVIHEVKRAFPNRGFHKKLIALTKSEFRKHPLRPLPMMKG